MVDISVGQKPRVLVVEDDPLLSSLLVQKLDRENFGVLYAPTGEAALDQVKSGRPDIIVLDILLPGKSGFDVLAEIKADPTYKTIPVIILSNLGLESDIQKGKDLGAVAFIVKVSLTLDEVIAKITAVWRAHQG